MAMFAEYEPDRPGGAPPEGLVVRAATTADLGDLAAIRAERDAMPLAAAAAAFTRILGAAAAGTGLVLAACIDEAVAGYGVAERLAIPGLPEGWYLGGVVVRPALRRRGIGARLTQERLHWIAGRAGRAYYFVNARNRASIDLHDALGFREVARDIRVPGVTFTDGIGLLFAADLPVPRPPTGAPALPPSSRPA